MTDREICEKIVKNGNCFNISVACRGCPLRSYCLDGSDTSQLAEKWLKNHRSTITLSEKLMSILAEAATKCVEAATDFDRAKRMPVLEAEIISYIRAHVEIPQALYDEYNEMF